MHRARKLAKRRSEGAALVTSLLALVAILILMFALTSLRMSELDAITAGVVTTQAQLTAEAGIDTVVGMVVQTGSVPAGTVSGTIGPGVFSAEAMMIAPNLQVVSTGTVRDRGRTVEVLLDTIRSNLIFEEYAILVCHDLTVTGNADVVNGDIYSGGKLVLDKTNVLVNGDARAYGNITLGADNAVTGNVISKTGSISGGPGTQNKELVRGDAVNPANRSTLTPKQVRGAISHEPDRYNIPDYCESPLYEDQVVISEEEMQAYREAAILEGTYLLGDHTASTLPNPIVEGATYYIEGDLTLNASMTASATFIIQGDLAINGDVTIDGPGGSLALVVNGNVTKGNGNATVNGVIYTNGSIEMGNGNFDVRGAIVMADKNGESNLSGNVRIEYVRPSGEVDLPNSVIVGANVVRWRLISN